MRSSTYAFFAFLALQLSAHANAGMLTKQSDVPPFGENVNAYGYARLAGESVVHYTEQYIDSPMNDTLRASYWSSSRDLIAYKQLNFDGDSIIPAYYEMVDYRRARGYRVKVTADIAKVESIKLSKNGTQYVYKSNELEITDNTIIDAGFHRFVIRNWQKLLDGKSMKMKFLQVDKPRLVPLKIKKTDCDSQETACFKIKLDNFLLQGVVPSIKLKYDISTQKLIRYSGFGVITKPNGKELAVDIQYEHRGS